MQSLLSIDDDRSVHHLVQKALEHRELEFHSALTAEDGLSKIESCKPDAVLLDVMLPDMSGLELYKKIRAVDNRIPGFFITAGDSSDTAIEAMRLGAFEYLTKPIDVDQLEQRVDQALATRRLMSIPVGMRNLLTPDDKGDAFVGRCRAMQDVFKAIGRVAPQNVA